MAHYVDEIGDIVYPDIMGRPPLNMKPTIVRFSEEILKRIDQLVGEKHRAKFIREAVLIEIERREKKSGDQ